jgi:hypothetical protein
MDQRRGTSISAVHLKNHHCYVDLQDHDEIEMSRCISFTVDILRNIFQWESSRQNYGDYPIQSHSRVPEK